MWQGTLTYYHGSELYIEWVRDLSHSCKQFTSVYHLTDILEIASRWCKYTVQIYVCTCMCRMYMSEYVSVYSIHFHTCVIT